VTAVVLDLRPVDLGVELSDAIGDAIREARTHLRTDPLDLCRACGQHWPCPTYFSARCDLIRAGVPPALWAVDNPPHHHTTERIMMPSRRSVLAAMAATAATPIIPAGCSHPAKRAAPAKGMDKVTYLTGFGLTPRETYVHVGVAEGFYAEVGIDVDVKPGAPSDANLTDVTAGRAQFAAIDWVSAIRGAKTFTDVRTIMAVQNRTLLSIITLAGRGIETPLDLAGKTIGTASASAASDTMFAPFARSAGLDPKTVKRLHAAPDQLPILLARKRFDAIGTYLVDTPLARKDAGVEPVVIPYSSYLGDLYGTVVVANTSVRTDLAARFANATSKAVKWAVSHTKLAGEAAHSKVNTVDADLVDQTMALMGPDVGSPLLEPYRVAQGIAVVQGAGLIPSGVTPNDVVNFEVVAELAV
jgi:NitT/TauT family transport system substrate-binding protein